MIPHSKPTIGEQEIQAVAKVLRRGHLAPGREAAAFEKALTKKVGHSHAFAVHSGSAALHLALLALKVDAAREVILPSYTCAAVLNAVHYVGAVPHLVDSDPATLGPCPDAIGKALSPKTGAIIFPHMFGCTGRILEAVATGVPVIEDCAMSIGGKGPSGALGTTGAIAIFSFYATKVMATGHGGAVATSSAKIARCIQDLLSYDERDNYRIRFNYTLADVNAAIGRVQLRRLGSMIRARQTLAKAYHEGLADLPIGLPQADPANFHIYYRYMIQVPKGRNALQKHLALCHIEAKPPVYRPLHRLLGLLDKDFPVATKLHKQGLSLPIYPELSHAAQQRIIRAVRDFYR